MYVEELWQGHGKMFFVMHTLNTNLQIVNKTYKALFEYLLV